jgi:hypothetical protein
MRPKLSWIASKSSDLVHRVLNVTRAPVNAITLLAYREGLVRRIDERRHAAHNRIARDLLEQLVAGGASAEGETVRIERIAFHYFAELIAEEMTFNIQNVGCGAEALITCQERACVYARET